MLLKQFLFAIKFRGIFAIFMCHFVTVSQTILVFFSSFCSLVLCRVAVFEMFIISVHRNKPLPSILLIKSVKRSQTLCHIKTFFYLCFLDVFHWLEVMKVSWTASKHVNILFFSNPWDSKCAAWTYIIGIHFFTTRSFFWQYQCLSFVSFRFVGMPWNPCFVFCFLVHHQSLNFIFASITTTRKMGEKPKKTAIFSEVLIPIRRKPKQ